MTSSLIHPYQWVAIRMPSDNVKVEQMTPNITVSLGKFGSFKTNWVIGRPFYLTWEVREKSDTREGQELRVVTAAELNADTLLEEAESELTGDTTSDGNADDDGMSTTVAKSNVSIIDDPLVQKLTMEDIEALKADEMGSPKDLIAKIMASHAALDQKTAFSLAKYILRKQKKYMKRFTVLPFDVSMMVDWMLMERDAGRVMEIRNETIGLIGSWANVHAVKQEPNNADQNSEPQCRYLVVDDTGGLVVAALAERMGILHHNPEKPESKDQSQVSLQDGDDENDSTNKTETKPIETAALETQPEGTEDNAETLPQQRQNHYDTEKKPPRSNTIHMVHSNQQPNLSLLRYFNFDPNLPPAPNEKSPHPLHTHLKAVSWLQLLEPGSDSAYTEPPAKTAEELYKMKSNARSTYYRKRRRWEKCKAVVDETRAGGFNALVIATFTNPLTILQHLVPLLAGGAQIVVYHPHVEPLAEVVDAYSTARRTAFLNIDEAERTSNTVRDKFPVDPTLTLGFMLQTARVRKWQVLPGRTHPLMTSKGGAESYVAVATRVLPVKGKIQARGKQGRSRSKRKAVEGDEMSLDIASTDDAEGNSSSDDDAKQAKRMKVESVGQDEDVDMQAAVLDPEVVNSTVA